MFAPEVRIVFKLKDKQFLWLLAWYELIEINCQIKGKSLNETEIVW